MSNTTVRALSSIDLRGSLLFGKPLTDFPVVPRLHEVVVRDGVMWIYSNLKGITTWHPLNKAPSTYVHNQSVGALIWNVSHNLDTPYLQYTVYDGNGGLVVPGYQFIDNNNFQLIFTTETIGHVVVFADAPISTGNLTADRVAIGQSVLNTDPVSGRLAVNGDVLATASDIDAGINSVTEALSVSIATAQIEINETTVITATEEGRVAVNGDLLATTVELSELAGTNATKTELTNAVSPLATKAELTPLATKTELTNAISPLATKTELTPLATKAELTDATSVLATKAELTNAVSPLATKTELAPLATKTELTNAVSPLATKTELTNAISPLATKTEVTNAINAALAVIDGGTF